MQREDWRVIFEDFVREDEFGSAINLICDFLIEQPSLIPSKSTLEQIEGLFAAMDMEPEGLDVLKSRFELGGSEIN